MRALEEIKKDVNSAVKVRDLEALERLVGELSEDDSLAVRATRASTRGVLLWLTEDLSGALIEFDVAQDLYELDDNQIGLAGVLNNIGNVFAQTGDYPAALPAFKRALEIHTSLGSRYDMAITAGNIGSIADLMGDPEAALRRYEEALELFTEIGEHGAAANVTGNIGGLYMRQQESEQAVDHLRRALTMLPDTHGVHDSARIKGNLAAALLDLGRGDEALVLLNEQESVQGMATTTRIMYQRNRARVYDQQGQPEEAHKVLQQALDLAETNSLRDIEAKLHLELRENARARNDMPSYVHHNKEYISLTEELSGTNTLLKVAMQAKQREIEAINYERERERAVLYSTLPRHIADRVIRGERVSGDHYRSAVVIFVDIVRFTDHVQSLGAKATTLLLDSIYTAFDEICNQHGLTKIKTIGDAYLAVAFGDGDEQTSQRTVELASQRTGELASRAAKAALAMISSTFTWPDGTPVQTRGGIHLGPLTAGVIGTKHLQYDVWGDTVNVASQMESTGEPGQIHISGTFAKTLKGLQGTGMDLKVEERGEVEVKGKGSMQTYWLEKG